MVNSNDAMNGPNSSWRNDFAAGIYRRRGADYRENLFDGKGQPAQHTVTHMENVYENTIALTVVLLIFSSFSVVAQIDVPADDSQPAVSNIACQPYPQIYSDLRVAFRLKAPEAQTVRVHVDKDYDMQRGKPMLGAWLQIIRLECDLHPRSRGDGHGYLNPTADLRKRNCNKNHINGRLPDTGLKTMC
jgi:hypothetical protein